MEHETLPKKSRWTKKNIVIAMSSIIGLAAGATTAGIVVNNNSHQSVAPTTASPTPPCGTSFDGWAACTDTVCPSLTDPSVHVYRVDHDCTYEYKRIPSSLYLLERTLCPSDHEIRTEPECTDVAKNTFGKPGNYYTSNPLASKCYYNTDFDSVHFNPYDNTSVSDPNFIPNPNIDPNIFISICKNISST